MPSTDLGNQEASFPAQPCPLLQVPVVCPIFPRNTPPFGPGSGRPREPRLRALRTPRAAGARPARSRCPCLSTRMPVAPGLGCGRPGSKHHRAASGGAGSPLSPPRALPCEREEEAGGRLRRGAAEGSGSHNGRARAAEPPAPRALAAAAEAEPAQPPNPLPTPGAGAAPRPPRSPPCTPPAAPCGSAAPRPSALTPRPQAVPPFATTPGPAGTIHTPHFPASAPPTSPPPARGSSLTLARPLELFSASPRMTLPGSGSLPGPARPGFWNNLGLPSCPLPLKPHSVITTGAPFGEGPGGIESRRDLKAPFLPRDKGKRGASTPSPKRILSLD